MFSDYCDHLQSTVVTLDLGNPEGNISNLTVDDVNITQTLAFEVGSCVDANLAKLINALQHVEIGTHMNGFRPLLPTPDSTLLIFECA